MTFQEQFDKEFRGRFRLRESVHKNEYYLEQKVHHAQILEPLTDKDDRYDTHDDEYVRAKDGFFKIMTIRQGDRMPCPRCHKEVKLPVMETKEVICPHCTYGTTKKTRWYAAYYPLNQTLIDHVKDIDPYYGGPERVRERMKARRATRLARESKAAFDAGQENVDDNRLQIDQIPMVGYGPKTAQRGDHTRFE